MSLGHLIRISCPVHSYSASAVLYAITRVSIGALEGRNEGLSSIDI